MAYAFAGSNPALPTAIFEDVGFLKTLADCGFGIADCGSPDWKCESDEFAGVAHLRV
jgi:hypothetical protein